MEDVIPVVIPVVIAVPVVVLHACVQGVKGHVEKEI